MFNTPISNRGPRRLSRSHRSRSAHAFHPAFELLENRTLLSADFGFAIGLGSSALRDSGGGVATDGGGNVYVTGKFGGTVDFDPGPDTFNLTDSGDPSGGDAFIAKYSSTGQLVWARAIAASGGITENVGSTIQVDASGNVYAGGAFVGTADLDPGPGSFLVTSNPLSTNDGFVVKLDPLGEFLWGGQIGTNNAKASLESIDLDAGGNIYLTGRYGAPPDTGPTETDLNPGAGTFNVAGQGSYAVKLDGAGQFIWARTLDGDAFTRGIAVDSSGDIHIAGGFSGAIDFDPGPGTFFPTIADGSHLFVWKLDSSGNLIWARAAGGLGANGIAVNTFGEVLVAGVFRGPSDFDPGPGEFILAGLGTDAVLWKLDSSGNFLTAHRFGSNGPDQAWGVAVDSAGDEYLFGEFNSTVDFDPGPGVTSLTSAGGGDAFILKLDTDGTLVWVAAAGGLTRDGVGATGGPDIAVDPAGNVYSTGIFSMIADFDPGPGVVELTSNGGFFDAFVWKLTQTPDVIDVQIDIKPGDDPSSVNLASNGVIAVVVYTTADFDAAAIDVHSVLFAGATAVGSALEDIDSDGDLDLVLHFRTQETNLRDVYEQLVADDLDGDGVLDASRQAVTLSLSGETVDDAAISGLDSLDLFLSGRNLRELLEELAQAGVI